MIPDHYFKIFLEASESCVKSAEMTFDGRSVFLLFLCIKCHQGIGIFNVVLCFTFICNRETKNNARKSSNKRCWKGEYSHQAAGDDCQFKVLTKVYKINETFPFHRFSGKHPRADAANLPRQTPPNLLTHLKNRTLQYNER